MTIYELTKEFLDLVDAGEDEEYDPEIIQSMKDDLMVDIETKVESYAKVEKELAGKEAALDAEIKRLTAMKDSIANNRKTIKTTMRDVMIATDHPKIKTNLFNMYVKKNAPSVKVDVDVNELPIELLRIPEPTANLEEIKKLLKAEENLPEEEKTIKYAHLESTQSLIIR